MKYKDLTTKDLKTIAHFHRIVKNYLKMKRLDKSLKKNN